ncbi:MAG: trypsin-like peptidase domain-containing protein [Clostridia bacterium]|nr:trypsin-like peptidase domain-containing protein [Clostridia bacterium]
MDDFYENSTQNEDLNQNGTLQDSENNPAGDVNSEEKTNAEHCVVLDNDCDSTYRYKSGELYPVPTNRMVKNVAKKQKKPKTWLVSAVSAVVGALVFSLVSPVIPSIWGNEITKTAKDEHKKPSANLVTSDTTGATQVVYKEEAAREDGKTPLSTVEIGKTVGPCVVGVVSEIQGRGFFSAQTSTGSGSGVICSAEGHIITNYHVIENATSVKVVLNTGDEYDASLIGADERTDLAVIKIDAPNLPVAVLGDSTKLEAGEKVVAIGNPLGMEFAGSLTHGIISAVNRTITVDGRSYNMIQTDAAINPGNSGGALVNEYGEVIGINSVKVASSMVEGLGFAIPISEAKPIIEDLMDYGYVKGRPLVGIQYRYISEQEAYYYNLPSAGLVIIDVTPGTGADNAGLQRGDIILECDGEIIESDSALNDVRDKHKAGDTLNFKINRNGDIIDVPVVLGEDTPTKFQ